MYRFCTTVLGVVVLVSTGQVTAWQPSVGGATETRDGPASDRKTQAGVLGGGELGRPGKHWPEVHPSRVLVRFRPGVTRAAREDAHDQARSLRTIREFRAVGGLMLVEVPDGNVGETIEAYRKNPGILYAEPDYTVCADAIPNDPDFGLLWGLRNIGQLINGDPGTPGADIRATDAWNLWTGDPNFKIAVIDSGVDYNHPDLEANIWTNPGEIPDNDVDDDGNGWIDDVHGYDFRNNDADPLDDHRHGSHVAGTIGGVADNGVGVAGVNWQSNIVALKFICATG